MPFNRFPKSRIDSLTDGIFAFAMTLLVLDIRLPSGLPFTTASELSAHLLSLWHQMMTYVISFFVLGAFWRGSIEARPSGALVDGRMVQVALLFLFFVTVVPFSSSLVGRYGEYAPAVIVYAVNMILLGLLAIAVRHFDVVEDKRSLRRATGRYLPIFLASAVLSMIISLIVPHHAMYAYFLNVLTQVPAVRRWNAAVVREAERTFMEPSPEERR